MENFKSLIQVMDYFKEESTCRYFLAQQRWGDTPCCPHCGNVGAYITNRGYKCKAKECHKKFTVITGTVFENTKISLRTWYAAIYLATAHKKGISSAQLARDLHITQKTAWFVLHRVREILIVKSPEKLRGTIEADETYIGGKDKNKHKKKQDKDRLSGYGMGRGSDKAPVVALLQRNGDVRAFAITKVSGSILYDLITHNVEKGSRLLTDAFSSYNWVGRQYSHMPIKHNKDFVTVGDRNTNSVEGFFSHLKRMIIGIYHYTSPKHLQRYCDEISYRYNTRLIEDGQRFRESFQHVNKRLTYKRLIA